MWYETLAERLAGRMEREPTRNGLWVWSLRVLVTVALWCSVSVLIVSLLA